MKWKTEKEAGLLQGVYGDYVGWGQNYQYHLQVDLRQAIH